MSYRYLFIEAPDNEAKVDFTVGFPDKTVKLDGLCVKIKREYNKHTGKATLSIEVSADMNDEILLDQTIPLTVYEPDEEEKEDEASPDDDVTPD